LLLSLGEKQRLAIARLLHHKPEFAVSPRRVSLTGSHSLG
jgi:ABC-type transport system involved in Fe-S cluster assembly fused permease/ATPase subunit